MTDIDVKSKRKLEEWLQSFEQTSSTDPLHKFKSFIKEKQEEQKVLKMTDIAQSRYGIVNELSEKKATLMKAKQQIRDNLEQIELNYKREGEDLVLQKKKSKENLESLDEQIKNYDEAIVAIKTISKEEKEKPV